MKILVLIIALIGAGCSMFLDDSRPNCSYLSEDQLVQGFKLSKGQYACFYENGNIDQLEPTDRMVIQGLTVPKGSRVYFYENGNIKHAMIANQMMVQGLNFPKATRINFRENGKLKDVILRSDMLIHDVNCPASVYIDFDENGKLIEQSCETLPDGVVRAQGIRIVKGSATYYSHTESIQRALLAEDEIIQGIKCKKGTTVEFTPSRKIKPQSCKEN